MLRAANQILPKVVSDVILKDQAGMALGIAGRKSTVLMKKSVCIISFSNILRDARVLRQIQCLSDYFDLTVIGFGQPHPKWISKPNVNWIALLPSKVAPHTSLVLLSMGKFLPSAYDNWYWRKIHHRQAHVHVIESAIDAIHVNEWDALPLAVEAARTIKAKIVFDAHEYTPGQYDNVFFLKRWLMQPTVEYFLQKYSSFVDASITVELSISKKLHHRFGLKPMVVLNAPEYAFLAPKQIDPENIRLIYHGLASPDRRLETMIETLKFCDKRYSLYFMLTESNPRYVRRLKHLANLRGPGRIFFPEAVPPEKIVQTIADYDVGFYILPPTNENNRLALPNKFFDFLMAGLAVCIGPSPSMAEIVNRYRLGCVAPTFEPRDIASILNQLNVHDLWKMKRAARKAAAQLNAGNEMIKVIDLYKRLLI